MELTFALTFATPWIAWTGLAAASGPIIIHLLNRFRHRVVDWAAMRFLLEAQKKSRRRLKLEELILLALRCLAILLIALAIARPRSSAEVLGVGPGQATDHVFVLDDSLSMGAARGDQTTFVATRDYLVDLLKAVPETDRVAILRTSYRGEPDPERWDTLAHITDVDRFAGRVGATPVSQSQGGLAEAVEAAGKLLAESRYRRKLYVLGDFRRRDFNGDPADRLRQQLDGMLKPKGDAQPVELTMIDHGVESPGNLTIESINLVDKHAIAGETATVAMDIRNNGLATVSKVKLHVTVDDNERPVEVIDSIAPGQSRRVEVLVSFPTPGPSAVTVELPADSLAGDNKGYLALEVREAIAVLIFDGEAEAGGGRSEAAFRLDLALNPRRDRTGGIATEVRSAETLSGTDLGRFDLVILCGVSGMPGSFDEKGVLTYPALAALKKYVGDGGAVLILTGGRIDLSFYNGPLYESGAGLNPLKLKDTIGRPQWADPGVTLLPESAADLPMLRRITGRFSPLARLVRFYRYTPSEPIRSTKLPEKVGPPRVLMSFDDKDRTPAIVERHYYDGMVMLVTTGLDAEWSDWGKAQWYPPMIAEMVRYLSSGRGGRHTGRVGRPINLAMSDLRDDAWAALRPPLFPTIDEVQSLTEGSPLKIAQGKIDYALARWAGIYLLTVHQPNAEPRTLKIARNIDPAEGDLGKASKPEIDAAVGGPTAYSHVDRNAMTSTEGPGDPVNDYWAWVLVAVLGVLALEVFLAQRFGHYT